MLNTQSACQLPGFRIISASFQILSFWTETSQPRTQEALFLTQRLHTAQIDTQRYQKQVTVYLHRELTTRVSDPQTQQRPNTL